MYMIAEVSQYVAVASFAEAWIEIPFFAYCNCLTLVASFAEAWIEIFLYPVPRRESLSPPSRRRGLKSEWILIPRCLRVASFAEAWIEIAFKSALGVTLLSPPSRRRGLKFFLTFFNTSLSRRLLRGGVDWNRLNCGSSSIPASVASFAEAWIEISSIPLRNPPIPGRLLRGGVDWNFESPSILTLFWSPPSRRRGLKSLNLTCCPGQYCRLLRGGVDWNCASHQKCGSVKGRLLRGGVDWNLSASVSPLVFPCRLLRGGVDWNQRWLQPCRYSAVASFAEAWIEISSSTRLLLGATVASFAEAWIEIMSSLAKSHPPLSPPSRRRGLKLCLLKLLSPLCVASFAEAWIEIETRFVVMLPITSPPSRRRGLKSAIQSPNAPSHWSPPSRRRGLKFQLSVIQTPLRFRRLLRGGVDWNTCNAWITSIKSVASFAEAWIEIFLQQDGAW